MMLHSHLPLAHAVKMPCLYMHDCVHLPHLAETQQCCWFQLHLKFVVCVRRVRVLSEASLGDQQLPAGLEPGQQLVIKQVQNIDKEAQRQLAEHEEAVLRSLSSKFYVPSLYGSYHSQEAEEHKESVQQCANLMLG